jgi:preprotein translocase subunit SecG
MHQILTIISIIVSVLLVLFILLQQRGATLGGAFGGESSVYSGRRGVEKYLYYTTIVLACLFGIMGILGLLIK